MKGSTHIDLQLAREALAAVVLAYTRLIMAALPDTVLSLRYTRKLRGHVRRFTRLKLKFAARVRREALAENPKLRKQVRFDLGGTTAMVKWERRWRETRAIRKAKPSTSSDPYAHIPRPSFDRTAPSIPRKRVTVWRPKTDRTEGYRLAAIPTGKLANPRKRPNIKTRLVKRDNELRDYPIEVTAQELHPSYDFYAGYWQASTSDGASPGHAPPIDRPPI